MSAIDLLADRQADWSAAANRLKNDVDKARWTTFLLSVAGATLAAVASQLPVSENGSLLSNPRTWVALAGVLSLATATFLTSRLLSVGQITNWITARAVSESLKREGFKYAAGARPYDDDTVAGTRLDDERRKIEEAAVDLERLIVRSDKQGSVPRIFLSQDDYIDQRVKHQIEKFYRPKARQYLATAQWLRRIEFTLALTATLVTAAASVTGKSIVLYGSPFDIAALTAVLTTVAGAVVAHIEANRLDYLVASYLAAARHLENQLASRDANTSWSDFVDACETIIAQENAAWIVKWKS